MGQRGLVRDRRQRLNKREGTLSSSPLITTHPARCNGQRGPDYPARRPMQYGILCIRAVHGRCWTGTARVSSHKAGERLGSSSKAFSSNKNLSARQRDGLVEAHLLGSIILPLVFPTELPAQINPQPGGPGDWTLSDLYPLTCQV